MKTCIIVIFLCLCTVHSRAQLTVKDIDSIAAKIDSVKDFKGAILDGRVSVRYKSLFKKLFFKKKGYGFGENFESDKTTGTLSKVTYTDPYRQDVYYFYSDRLILVKTQKHGLIADKHCYYFSNDSLIHQQGADVLPKYVQSLVDTSHRYLDDNKDMNSMFWHHK